MSRDRSQSVATPQVLKSRIRTSFTKKSLAKVLQGPKLKSFLANTTLGQFFFSRADEYKDKICQIDAITDEKETYSSVKTRSVRVALELERRGISAQDVIAICSEDTMDSTIPAIASLFLGATVVNIDPTLSFSYINYLLSVSTPTIVFVEEPNLLMITKSLKEAKLKSEVIVMGNSRSFPTFNALNRLDRDEQKFRPLRVDMHERAVMFFTSGTSGPPKAVCHTHYSFMQLIQILHNTGSKSRNILHFPMSCWITSLMILTFTFMEGLTRVFCREVKNAEVICNVLDKYKLTSMFMSAKQAQYLTDLVDFKNFDLSSLQYVVITGTSVNIEQIKKLCLMFSHADVIFSYGALEVGVICTFNPETDKELLKTKLGSCGKPAPETEIKVMNFEGEDFAAPNEKGEIRVKSAGLMIGYHRHDDADAFDKDGFLKTGDVGYYDRDDCLYVVDRLKNVFKYQNHYVVPAAIENVLLGHPAVKKAVVFGVPKKDLGEVPAACVELRREKAISESQLEKYVEDKVDNWERLRGGITCVDKLPTVPVLSESKLGFTTISEIEEIESTKAKDGKKSESKVPSDSKDSKMGRALHGPKIQVYLENVTLGQMFFNCADRYSDNVCQIDVDADESETYGSVKSRSVRLALELERKGIGTSHTIAVISNNGNDNIIPILASFYLGTRVVVVDPNLTSKQAAFLLNMVTPSLLFVEEVHYSTFKELLKENNIKAEVIVLGKTKVGVALSSLTRVDRGEDRFHPTKVDIHETAMLFFSSGSTGPMGQPKAICHSHYSFLQMAQITNNCGVQSIVTLHFPTYCWITIMIIVTCSFLQGLTRVISKELNNDEDTFRIIEKYHVTAIYLTPSHTSKLINVGNAAKKYNMSSLEFVIVSGGQMNPKQFKRISDVFKDANLIFTYGLTEVGMVSIFNPSFDAALIKTKINSCGKVAPETIVKIVKFDSEAVLGPNEKGEIRVKSIGLMMGYHNIVCSDLFDDEGFLKTGDVGYYDSDDCLYVLERVKDVFYNKSLPIVPAYLEKLLYEHPNVREAVVFGVPRSNDGEVPVAYVVLKTNSSKSEIQEFVNKKVADHEKIKEIVEVPTMPKTSIGKVSRKDIRSGYLEAKKI